MRKFMTATTRIPGLCTRLDSALRWEMKSLGGDVPWGIGWRRLFEGGNDGSEKQVDARGSGNRGGDW
jgi:hypothetical protein